jgi:hypothetical protein
VYWCVEVVGDGADLSMLAESLSDGPTSITRHAGGFILGCDSFSGLDSARDVAEHAKQVLAMLSGSTRLLLGGRASMTAGAVYRVRDDGNRDTFLITEPGRFELRGMPVTTVVSKSDGTREVHRPADPIRAWVELGTTDGVVAKALRLRDDDSRGWVELYRLYEVIESDVGRSAVVANGWTSDRDIGRFKHTANSVEAAGDQARHGKEETDPPAKPLSLAEARALIDRLLLGWLASKAGLV